jgi:hypothetical protein
METMMHSPGLDALVRASRTVNTPTEDARERNRKRLAVRIAAGMGAAAAASGAREAAAAVAGGPASAAGSAGLAGGLAKWAVISVLIAAGSGTGAGVYVARTRTHAPAALAAAPLPAEPLAPVSLAGEPVAPIPPAVPPPALPVSEPRARVEPSASPAGSTLEARAFERELGLLRSARRALDTGSPALSLSLLDQYAAEFPHGALKSECQATRILALCAAGRVASAQQARDQFLKQQPGSPLAERLRTSCGGGR